MRPAPYVYRATKKTCPEARRFPPAAIAEPLSYLAATAQRPGRSIKRLDTSTSTSGWIGPDISTIAYGELPIACRTAASSAHEVMVMLFWVALAINAGVWDAVSVAALKKGWYAGGISCALVAGSFDSLALQSIAPHVLAGIRALSAFGSICLCQAVPAVPKDVIIPAALVAAGSIVGACTVLEQRTGRRGHYDGLYAALAATTAGCIFGAIAVRLVWPKHPFSGSRGRFLLPVADAAISTMVTATLASFGTSANLYTLVAALLLGLVALVVASVSLAVNRPQDHVLMSYAGWSFGLLASDLAGRYRVHIAGTVVQFVLIACGLATLIYRRGTMLT